MIGLDTNVLVRYLTQDDKAQASRSNKLIESKLSVQTPGYVTLVTLVEVVWVLESCYEQTKSDVLNVIQSLLTTKQLIVESSDVVYLAKKRYEDGNADFSDALIAAVCKSNGCSRVVTFDKKAVNVGMELMPM